LRRNLTPDAGCLEHIRQDRQMARSKGFGLLDLMVTLVIASMLMTLAIPAYDMFVKRAKVAKAIGDIGSISIAVERFRLQNNDQIPASLNLLNIDVPVDPWGRPYSYLNIRTAGPGNGGLRKDGKLNPLNSDFDLFSLGKDGASSGPLSAKASRDDIVRANDGAFIGLGEDY
jgi:general secretion pathway protein G